MKRQLHIYTEYAITDFAPPPNKMKLLILGDNDNITVSFKV